MGYNFDLVVRALRTLRADPKYNSFGEIQKTINWINAELDRQE